MKYKITLKRKQPSLLDSSYWWYGQDDEGKEDALFCQREFGRYWEIPESITEIDLILSTTKVEDAYRIDLNGEEQSARFQDIIKNIQIHTLQHGIEEAITAYAADKYLFQLFKEQWPNHVWAYIEYEEELDEN